MKCVVLGGAGAMGRIIVRDLVETASQWDKIVIADYDLAKAQVLAKSFARARSEAARVDVRNHKQMRKALAGAFVLINSTPYEFNLEVMEAALAAGAHYIDMGGLFHTTRKQLKLHEKFKAARLTALLGMGAAPGITNLLARFAADQLETVREIHVRVAAIERTRYTPKPALAVSYSLKTILDEVSFEPAVFTHGEFKFIKPMSGGAPHRFPAPIGVQRPIHTIHSEVATLPLSYQDKGIREVSFKIAFAPEFIARVRFLRDLGLASHELIDLSGVPVRPIDLANKVAMSQPVPQPMGKLRQYEILRAVVKGRLHDQRVTWIIDCHTSGMPAWDIGTDIDTGAPPSIGAQMLANKIITARGALPPEAAVPPEPFFKELKKRQITVKVQKRRDWAFSV